MSHGERKDTGSVAWVEHDSARPRGDVVPRDGPWTSPADLRPSEASRRRAEDARAR